MGKTLILITKKDFNMTEIEILCQILVELKSMNNTVQDLYSGIEAQNELLMNKLSGLERIVIKSNDLLSDVESNTKP